ncbi:MAG: ParB/RepB/Spo0J family partition protein [Magnetococcales bacterium]|nr:ParB/RepB/Spo0J family partition protein [Magnetococcales bacterium]MBF0438561.1 ParB/RepB/Spo0J family partition protein [Magnetococcales bacterium]
MRTTNASGMGQGLAALLGEAASHSIQHEKVHMIPVDLIVPNPHQPRQNFTDETLQELSLSIREQGVLLPLLVRSTKHGTDESYQLVAGERRLRAAKLAGLLEVPALVRNWTDRQALEASILENVQREDLNPVEIAKGCAELIETFNYSHKKVAQRLGKSREAITNHLRLLRLPETILKLVESNTLSSGHARALLRLEADPAAMERLSVEVITKELSVRQTEILARTFSNETPLEEAQPPIPTPGRGRQRDPIILSIEEKLSKSLHAQVAITHLRGKGRVIVEYANLDELEALAERLLHQATTP